MIMSRCRRYRRHPLTQRPRRLCLPLPLPHTPRPTLKTQPYIATARLEAGHMMRSFALQWKLLTARDGCWNKRRIGCRGLLQQALLRQPLPLMLPLHRPQCLPPRPPPLQPPPKQPLPPAQPPLLPRPLCIIPLNRYCWHRRRKKQHLQLPPLAWDGVCPLPQL